VRIAALYDIHGNQPALQAVLAEIDLLGVDAIVAGVDVASGPMPVETLEALRGREAFFIRGNADRVLDVGAQTTVRFGCRRAAGSPSASGRNGCPFSRSYHST
jgi:hypothetical protein